MATTPTTATAGTALNALETAIVTAIENVIGSDWRTIQQGATAAARNLAAVSVDLTNPANTMTPDEKLEVMSDYKDSLRNALLYGRVVTKVAVEQAIDAAGQAIVAALPALVGIA